MFSLSICSIGYLCRGEQMLRAFLSCGVRVSCRPVLGGGDSPPKISYSPPKFVLTLFLFTLSPLPLGYSPPKVLQLPPPPSKGEILQETLGVVVQCNGFLLKLCCVLHTADAVCGLPDLEETELTEKEAGPVPPPPCPLLERADLSNFRHVSGTRGVSE